MFLFLLSLTTGTSVHISQKIVSPLAYKKLQKSKQSTYSSPSLPFQGLLESMNTSDLQQFA
jgi:hypothetical protein